MSLYRFVTFAIAASTLLGLSVSANLYQPCLNPSVRLEWRSMPAEERAEWLAAVKCLNNVDYYPHNSSLVPTFNTTFAQIPPVNPNSSYFDDWSYIHMDLNHIIHFTGQFLPWHRAFIKDFDTSLREKCGYTGHQPYWDWTKDASDFENSAIFDPDPVSGLGGWGDPNDDYQITSGAFATDFPLTYPSPHRLRRQYTPDIPGTNGTTVHLADLFTPESQQALIEGYVADFIHFQQHLEGGSHGAIHRIVGADLLGTCPSTAPSDCVPGPKWSPNDPLFQLHHGMVDKVWYDWQHAHPANFWSFDGGATPEVNGFIASPDFPNGAPPYVTFATPIPTDGIMNNYTIWELIDTRNERLCYIYE
ncbi:Di-copper centre-containing protein [Thelephora terrestris]|jgi:tyrosinase|uniref:Di-copper centre-containing protein n=1 Tax=Thelephora terrestris TaxID=56493 RepID=A0A9P6H4S6_9AGAM|nr:Di-copper centre-containing protein [Thelephora terrestris]